MTTPEGGIGVRGDGDWANQGRWVNGWVWVDGWVGVGRIGERKRVGIRVGKGWGRHGYGYWKRRQEGVTTHAGGNDKY